MPAPKPSIAPETMTARRRLLAALRGERADRVPAWLMRQAGRYLPEYNAVRAGSDFLTLCKTPEPAAEVSIQPLGAIGSDAVIVFNDILVPLEHAGADVTFDERGPLIRNPIGVAGDLKRLAARAVRGDEAVARTIRRVRERVGEDVPILGFIGAPWTLATYWVEGRASRDLERIGALRWRDPALLEALLDRIAPVAAEYLRIQIQAGADAVQIFDTWGGQLDPAGFARLSAPYLRRVIEAVKPLGAPVIVYVNGCAALLDQLCGIGADCLSVDWRIDLAAVRERVGAGIALQGNLDPRALLAGPEATEQAVRELFEKFPPGPGHVFNLGHGILPATPVESARTLMEAVKTYGAY
jgi:uroporphyrinogen decarboxylase